ncbi:MAG: hypothetical protein AABW54_01645 [Candidatus Micrarchaeota archaeon]
MVKKQANIMPVVGAWLFVIGLVVALVAGFVWSGQGWVPLLLGVIGVIVGLVNIGEKETMAFLVAAIAFNVAANNLADVARQLNTGAGDYLVSVFVYAGAFVAPAAAVVAIKSLYEMAKSA